MTDFRRGLMNALTYFPSRDLPATPAAVQLDYEERTVDTEDGERLHGWWIPTRRPPALAHLLHCHGNAGNVADRIFTARALGEAGFNVLLFDYRGYGRSTGTPDEEGTYRDGQAARRALEAQARVDVSRIVYLGESLGAAVAIQLALTAPPAWLVLQSAFTSIREMRRAHYPFIPEALVPDAYPSLRRIREVRCPVLVLHGERDEIVPVSHARALHEAAPGPKRLLIVPGAGHNDLEAVAGPAYAATIAGFCGSRSLC